MSVSKETKNYTITILYNIKVNMYNVYIGIRYVYNTYLLRVGASRQFIYILFCTN